jgi:serum/glucocorticoid-regulated kinase 2
MAAAEEKYDHLALASNAVVAKMLAKNGKNLPAPEKVVFSDFVIKINKREKEQTRVMLITDKALYNLLPNDYGKMKRRIDITSIFSITCSTVSDEFIVHVADEYDYRYKSGRQKMIASVLKQVYSGAPKSKDKPGKLPIVHAAQDDLKDLVFTKAMARLQTREEAFQRLKELAAQEHDSDREEEADGRVPDDAEAKDQVTQLMHNNPEKVTLDDFELLKVLGRGSFGKVMQVRKKDTGQVFAMKILKKRAIIARNQVEHTKAERKILQQLQHPFLMTLRYAFQSKEKLYFVLDYYEGGELFFHLKKRRRFPEDVARIYVAEIAMALGHLHSLSVVYRDLKPENILLSDAGHVCLTDFGLSKDMAPDDTAHTFCGTPEYLAPEIVSGVGHTKAVDWWSLGILLYELTVGIPPFYSQNVNEMYNKIQHGVLRFPPFLSEECKSLIVGLLNRDPNKRLGSHNDVDDIHHHAFFKVLDWDKLYRKEIDPPYKPNVKGVGDVSNFDDTFTSEPVVDSLAQDSQLSKTMQKESDAFANFTYTDKNKHIRDDDD